MSRETRTAASTRKRNGGAREGTVALTTTKSNGACGRIGLLAATTALTLSLIPATVAAITPLPAQDAVELEPGTYVDNSLGFMFTFDVEEGWRQGFAPSATAGIELTTVDHQTFADGWSAVDNIARLAIVPLGGEVKTDGWCVPAGGSLDEYESSVTVIDTAPQSVVDHLSSSPLLDVSEAVPMQIGGFDGLRFDATATLGEDCETADIYLFDTWTLIDGDVATYVILDVDGRAVLIAIETSGDVDHGAFVERAMPVIESLKVIPM
jgi:hypothetical protein